MADVKFTIVETFKNADETKRKTVFQEKLKKIISLENSISI